MGGFLAQTYDRIPAGEIEFKVVSKRQPTEKELADLRFAWRVVKHVRSNAVVFARDGAILGIGAGQMSRLDAAVAAAHIARRNLRLQGQDLSAGTGALPLDVIAPPDTGEQSAPNSVMATDGFFPFPDAVLIAARAGATAIAHPGGARQDAAAIAAADEHNLAMVVTGIRHFRH
jgi:phosphoribosylaminoimidazolecarboxamide formyltransferase/IMP cyclohydrolase